MDTLFSVVSVLVSSSHETFVQENRWFEGGAIVETVLTDLSCERASRARDIPRGYGLGVRCKQGVDD